MVKLIGWSDVGAEARRPPPLSVKEEGSVLQFHDYPYMYGLEVGDQIHYQTGLGVVVFTVAEVQPADLPLYPPEMNLVTAKKLEKT